MAGLFTNHHRRLFSARAILAAGIIMSTPLYAAEDAATPPNLTVSQAAASDINGQLPEGARTVVLLKNQTINDYEHPIMVGGMISTLGYGAQVQYGLPFDFGFNHFAVRGGFNQLSFEVSEELGTGNSLSLKTDISTPELLLDLYPSAGSGFHFTVGAMFPTGGAKVNFDSAGIKIDGKTYANINANMDIDINSDFYAPYVGIGLKSWSGARANSNNWVGVNLDLGAMMISPKATGSLSCGSCEFAIDAQGVQIPIADLKAKFNQSVIDKANASIQEIEFYPVIRMTVSIIF
ncbi:MAG: hypothetical protein QM523_00790 [Candidatus Pacebacteria bacterium]|nr:hypothetical protein [Candidatus Paceibacterota bacterium]